ASDGPGIAIGDQAPGSIMSGLVINGFSRGIQVEAPNVTVKGCFLGVDPTGAAPVLASGTGVIFEDSHDTSNGHVGGTTPDARNLICGSIGVFIGIPGQVQAGHVVEGNLIGTDKSGLVGIPTGTGVLIESNDNLIGGSSLAARNVINGASNGI